MSPDEEGSMGQRDNNNNNFFGALRTGIYQVRPVAGHHIDRPFAPKEKRKERKNPFPKRNTLTLYDIES